jgi:hypothetical protein
VEAKEPLPASLHASRRRRRLALLVAVVLAVTTAAVATVVAQHHSGPAPSGADTYTVEYEATGSTHSATIRWAIGNGPLEELDGLDLVDRSPYDIVLLMARGTQAIIEVQRTSPSGAVGCSVNYGLSSDTAYKSRSAPSALLANCTVELP